jgi:PleD family two-component response regulator
MLLTAGYENITAVESAAAAYRHLGIGGPETEQPPAADLVLLDVVMPGIDGIEACARIRSERRYLSVPVVMVTSLADTDSLANAFVAGANDYITKPVNRVELLARVRSALKLKSELDRREARERELLQLVSELPRMSALPCIDEATGLFSSHVADGYLAADAGFILDGEVSVIALAIDRIDACLASQGPAAAAAIVAEVARAVRTTAATVDVIAAAYGGGMVLIAPGMGYGAALALAEALRASVAASEIPNPESIAADYVTASAAVVTGTARSGSDRSRILRAAIASVSKVAPAEGNRVVLAFV